MTTEHPSKTSTLSFSQAGLTPDPELAAHDWCADDGKPVDDWVSLTFDERQKSRYRTHTAQDRSLGWFLARGRVLQAGDILLCHGGERVRVIAAAESLSHVSARPDSAEAMQLSLLRAAYHLGNRHVPLAISLEHLCYAADAVLDDMVRGLGLVVTAISAPFTPEAGAYSAHHHDHRLAPVTSVRESPAPFSGVIVPVKQS
jgi:urease accessory protein